MTNRFFLFFSVVFSLVACRSESPSVSPIADNHYATGFTRSAGNGICKLTVRNPWEKAANVIIPYYLVGREAEIPDSLAGQNIIRIPVNRIICFSTSHLAYLELLGELDKVTGVSGSQYISHPYIRKRINEGLISDIGYGQNLDYEEIIIQKPDLVMVYGVDSEITGFLGKFRDLGIPVVIFGEYLESTPLGKAEWLKFAASFFRKEKLADSLFAEVESRYNLLRKKVKDVKTRPGVMVGLPYRDAWWIPGGNSYLARLIEDAGGDYVGKDNRSHESYVVSLEDALTLSSTSDIWINTGMVTAKQDILDMDGRFAKFPLFINGRIFNNNRRVTPDGGMDFWESGTVHPDIILNDLIRIFHPQISDSDSLTYYREIK